MRGLIVQSFQHGFSYEYMLHALTREPDRFRGCIIPAPDITDRELRILADAGVVAVRYGFKSAKSIDGRMLERCLGFGLQPHYLVHGDARSPRGASRSSGHKGRFVIEHMGYPQSRAASPIPAPLRARMPRYRAMLGQAVAALLRRAGGAVRGRAAVRARACAPRADPAAVGLGLAAPQLFQSDAE